LIELTYQAKIADGWTIQPDLQYIWNPGGRRPDPRDPTAVTPLKDAIIVGVRTTIKY
jgi:porin